MAKEFQNKYLVRYEKYVNKSLRNFEIIPLEILDNPNTQYKYWKNKVKESYEWYKKDKNEAPEGKNRDGEIIFVGETYWLLVDCAGFTYADQIFWKKYEDYEGEK